MIAGTVERVRIIIQAKHNGSHTDIILRSSEPHSQSIVALTAAHTTHEVDKRRVSEVVSNRAVKVEGSLGREASAINQRVTIEASLYIVVADRHTNQVVTIIIGLLHLTISGNELIVDV